MPTLAILIAPPPYSVSSMPASYPQARELARGRAKHPKLKPRSFGGGSKAAGGQIFRFSGRRPQRPRTVASDVAAEPVDHLGIAEAGGVEAPLQVDPFGQGQGESL